MDYWVAGIGTEFTSRFSNEQRGHQLLNFYKKGDVTWGSPLSSDSNRSKELKDRVAIYPNPANNFISVVGIVVESLELFDLNFTFNFTINALVLKLVLK